MKKAQFDSYKIFFSAEPYKYRAMIGCYFKDERVGSIKFFSAANTPEPHGYVNNQVLVSFSLDDFANVHSILLHESPLYLCVSEDGTVGQLQSDPDELEPIGEEE
ncbi:MAG: hypothetical protein PVJ71_00400 [Lysobacterales bacterium]|jgi:hypothetical protein